MRVISHTETANIFCMFKLCALKPLLEVFVPASDISAPFPGIRNIISSNYSARREKLFIET